MDLAPGTKLGRYEIRSKLGQGGMGEVYLAQDTKLDRKVAIKLITPDIATDKNRMNRFVQEAKAASALNHPNIITIHEIDDADLGQFIATEFIDGETLRERMRREPLKLDQVVDVAAQIASALSAAHSAGIVHRDIKPENVMLRRDGIVKVLDFGLAKLTEQTSSIDPEAPTRGVMNTEPGVVMGTAMYMSPEQARGLHVDERTDIFSLAVVMYEMLSGRLPFEGANTNEIVSSILSDKDPQPLARYSTEIPSELERIVSKALRKNRDERYQTSKDMLLDLKTLKQELEFEKKLDRSSPPRDRASAAHAGTTGSAETLISDINRTAADTSPAAKTTGVVGTFTQHKLVSALIVVALALAIAASYWFIANRYQKQSLNSIAVMPFENMTHDQTVEYISDGVTESLINSLSRLPQLRVIARNSVFSYKNQNPNLQQVAQQLNVQAVLTGRVMMQGDTLDVRVELTDTSNNSQIWGDHYQRKAADIFAVQNEIAQQVTEKLNARLTGAQRQEVTKRYTENVEAYNLYIQGLSFTHEIVGEDLNRAIPLFDKAIALDPQFALAYAARADAYFNLGDLSLRMSDAKLKVKQDLETALRIDSKLVQARTTLANLKFQYDWDFLGAEQDFKQAIALNANYAEAHHQYGWYLAMTGKENESFAEMTLAQQLDPMSPLINVDLNLPLSFSRRWDESATLARKQIDMFPNVFLPRMLLGNALFLKGDHAEGIKEMEKAKEMEPTPFLKGQLAYLYARANRKDEARKLLEELQQKAKERYVAPYWIAMIYVGLDEKDKAFEWFEKAYEERSWFLIFIKMDPMMDSVRSDPRYTSLIQRIGYPQ
ncbi:MAG TPA: protein kinase [Pyrinomonadaceae bacterium]|jgi:Serine/threonine protein kinase|nr:protein kinase [Pyrinomonadaceae bacterium]